MYYPYLRRNSFQHMLYMVYVTSTLVSPPIQTTSQPLFPTLSTSCHTSWSSYSLRPQLHTMPTLDLIRQDRVNHLMLLNHRQPIELRRLNLQRIHATTSTADILDLQHTALARLHNIYDVHWPLAISIIDTQSSVNHSDERALNSYLWQRTSSLTGCSSALILLKTCNSASFR